MPPVLDGPQSPNYKNTVLDNEYTIISGQMVFPIAAPPPANAIESGWTPFVVARGFSDIRKRNYCYAYEKERNPGPMQAPFNGNGFYFLGGTLTLPHPSVQSDGSFRWAGAVDYEYVESVPHLPTVGFVIGGIYDPFAIQAEYAGSQGTSANMPVSVRTGGVGLRVGWNLASQIDLTNAGWSYPEPSYYPAQLLSYDMLTGASQYDYAGPPSITISDFNPFGSDFNPSPIDSGPPPLQ